MARKSNPIRSRRLTRKTSDQLTVAPSTIFKNEVDYEQKTPWPSRTYVNGFGFQSLPQLFQEALGPSTLDLDISNAMFVIIDQIITKLQVIENPIWTTFIKLIKELATDRDELIRTKLKCSIPEGKQIIQDRKSVV